MNTLYVFALLCLGLAVAAPQFGGGSAGGLLGGEPLKHYVVGLSRGIEIKHEKHETHEKKEHKHDEHKKGGEGGGEHHHHHKQGEGGFGGSKFNTPVDVHHEEAVHLKAHPEYHYDYHVADHKHKDYKSKHEVRDGYKVKGTYSLLEPDHKTIRVVDYVSDKKTGFIAKVSYKKHQ